MRWRGVRLPCRLSCPNWYRPVPDTRGLGELEQEVIAVQATDPNAGEENTWDEESDWQRSSRF